MGAFAGVDAALNSAQQPAEAPPSAPNPTGTQAQQSFFSTRGVSEADQKMLKDTVTDYRASWAQDRLERIRQWMQNVFYWKGIQLIRWDNATNCWYDVLAWARSTNQDSGEDTDLERWMNPLVLMFCNVWVGILSRTLPKTVIKPQNADPALQDTVTAKAAQEASRIIERKNHARAMNRSMDEILFLFGTYFRETDAVLDGEMFGYDEMPYFEDMQINMPARFQCPNCGATTPATLGQPGVSCPNCGMYMGQESFYAAGEGSRTSLRMAGVKQVPKAGVKQNLWTPLEVDMDPKAKGKRAMYQTPILAIDREIDEGEARMLVPELYADVKAGTEAVTTPNASVEKLARLDAVSALGGMTADASLMNPTWSKVYVQPMAYHKKGDKEFAARMMQQFPKGLCMTMLGEKVVDIRPACLPKKVSFCSLHVNQGVYCHAPATTAVSFNARFNRAMWIIDDWASRASLGLNVVDGSRVDTEKMSGKPMPAGTVVSVPMRINGEPRPMEQIFAHFDMPLQPALLNYPQMLLTFLELIIGIPRQLSGAGTQHDVETAYGQQMQLDRGMTVLRTYWENIKDEAAIASGNAFLCLKELMDSGAVTQIMDVVKGNGGAFENVVVDWKAVQGNVEFEMDEDQDLPVSPDELRQAIQTIFEQLKEQNPAAAEWFAIPENQDQALSIMLPGSVRPSEAQELKTKADIQLILDSGPQLVMNPDGSTGSGLPVHPTKAEDFPVAKTVVSRYILEHFELRTEDVVGWQLLHTYLDELRELEAQVAAEAAQRQSKVTAAGAPPKAGPSPIEQEMQAEMQQLMSVAGPAIVRLSQLMQLDPSATKDTANAQVSAAKEVVDTTVDAAKIAAGGK